MRKKKILINTDYLHAKTGLGRNGKEVALHLYKTGKYEVYYYACGMVKDHPDYNRYPFKVIGALPNDQNEINRLNQDPNLARSAAYGDYTMEAVIKEIKPDVTIISNDSWATTIYKRGWFDNYKKHVVPHITLDSLPFLPDQVEFLKKTENFIVWSDFAIEESKKLGVNHVKRIGAAVASDKFFRLQEHERIELRNRFNIPKDAFIVGFVFRNQVRKELVPLMEGFAQFCRENPDVKNPYLLLHTSIAEGWDINRLAEQFNIDKKRILLTYICRNCHQIEVRHLQGHDLDCRFCNSEKSQITCNVSQGCTEEQLNEVYNLMDFYVHPANAGGFEIPICEALYCEIPTATVGYSAMEMFTNQSFVYSIEFAWGVQHGTQFKRACPYPSSVSKLIKKVYNTEKQKLREIGKKGREWALSQFSPQAVGQQWENIIDAIPFCEWDFKFETQLKNPDYPNPQIEDNILWIKDLYKNILKMDVADDDSGLNHWISALKNGQDRNSVYSYFVHVAKEENAKSSQSNNVSFESLLDNTGKERMLVVIKESLGDCIILKGIFASLKKQYPNYDLYVATEPKYFEAFEGDEHIHKVIPYQPFMEQEMVCIGAGQEKGMFAKYFHPAIATQRVLNYLSNDSIALNLKD